MNKLCIHFVSLVCFVVATALHAQTSIPWEDIDTTGSSLADIDTREFSALQNKPTTLSGYGITDAATSAQGAKADTALQSAAIGVTIQAYDADLADLADGSLTGSKVGTGINADNITAGTLGASHGGAGIVSGILKANGSGTVSAAVAGTDYASALDTRFPTANEKAALIGGDSATAIFPTIVYVKNLSVLTSGAPADIGTITIPSGIARWAITSGGIDPDVFVTGSSVVIESSSGALSSASIGVFTSTGGGGDQIAYDTPLLDAGGGGIGLYVSYTHFISNATSLTVRQLSNSANAGTISVYLLIYPRP